MEESNQKNTKINEESTTKEEDTTPRTIHSSFKNSGADYRCDYCRKDISKQHRIRCAECTDFDLCIPCFANGVSVAPHEDSHRYRVVEQTQKPIFDLEWTADEEMLLLEGISIYGFGNWSDISDHVGSKSKYRCETHYERGYLNSGTAPFAKSIVVSEEAKNPKEKGSDVEGFLKKISQFNKNNFPSLKISEPPKPKTLPRSAVHSSLLSSNVIGFCPDRGEFEVEYENDTEKLLAEMEFAENDTVEDKDLKLKIIRIYNKKLDQRKLRKDFLIKRGIYSVLPKNKRKLNNEEKHIHENMKPFARFQSGEDHEKLVNGMCNELRLRRRLEVLQHYRLNGYKSLSEIRKSEQKRNKKVDLAPMKYSPSRKTPKKERNNQSDGFGEIDSMEGIEKLRSNEIKLCKEIGLKADEYLKVKEAIERETYVKGMVGKDENECLITIKLHKTEEQITFIIYRDWEFKKKVKEFFIARKKMYDKKKKKETEKKKEKYN